MEISKETGLKKKHSLFNSGNIFLILANLFFIVFFASSIITGMSGYYFLPDSRERFLKLQIFIVAALSFGVISPNKKSNKVSLFTYVLMLMLPVSASLFIYRTVFRYIKYEYVYTLILSIMIVFLVFFASFERFKEYGSESRIFVSKAGKYLKRIPVILACMAAVFYVFILIRAGVSATVITEASSWSTQISPDEKYVAKLEEKYGGALPFSVNIYHKRTPVKVFMGKLMYDGLPFASYPQKSRDNVYIRWINGNMIEIQGNTYDIS